ncbi:MAG: SDR family NAD(P)-dependent oxidoreductase [Actinomycetota bacterium]
MNERNRRPIAVVTGASSGIGAAAAVQLSQAGFDLVLGARRVERLKEVAERCGGRAHALDVTEPSSVEAFVAKIEHVHLLVNNAGLALGRDEIAGISLEDTETMWQTNVMGLLRVTRALLPKLQASGDAHIINIGSIAGVEPYPAGGGYTASKHAVHAISRTLRMELVGQPIRVTEILPGLVETEFSIVRFRNDEAKAKKPYEGITPLTAEDIADCITWAATRPPHVNIDEIIVKPRAQATATMISRAPD